MSLPFSSTNNNLIIHASSSLFLTLLFTFIKIPSFFLHGLHTYIHPDDVTPPNPNSSGIKAAIRRPSDTTTSGIKPRKKTHKKFEFDENKAQIFRLKLTHNHLQSRLYFDQFNGAFNFTIVACSSLLIHNFLPVSKDSSGVLPNGTLIPILLGFIGVVRVLIIIVKVSFERSASKRSEKQLSVLIGCLGTIIGFLIVLEVIPNWVFDFGSKFESLDGYAKFCTAIFMGFLAGLLYVPAAKFARAYWLGTDQIRCNLSMIYCGWFGRILLYFSYLLTVFTSLLWINPFADLIVNKNIKNVKVKNVQYANRLTGNVGMSRSDFEFFRLCCLLATGVLNMISLRANLQMFLNEAVLSWYQRLHASKVPDLDYSRAKVFLHNHYLCLAGIQFFSPPALVLFFLGLSRINDNVLDHFPALCNLIPCSALVKEMSLFMGWWVVSVLGVLVSVNLALYRQGILYVS
ncbi:putative transmembrane protein 161A/B [Helianthus annuus]|nr:putative transmembrane protein 161A/B [Helianthus annuus]KAJ0887980.1 putative transmembrane protein 161A/B [Helianthus annuus]